MTSVPHSLSTPSIARLIKTKNAPQPFLVQPKNKTKELAPNNQVNQKGLSYQQKNAHNCCCPPSAQPEKAIVPTKNAHNRCCPPSAQPERAIVPTKNAHNCCCPPSARLCTLALAVPSGANQYPRALEGTTLQTSQALTCRKPPDTR